MPTTPSALAALGLAPATGYSNSAVVAEPRLWFLTDIFAMPPGMPFANVFSIADVFIVLGIAVTVVVAMRAGKRAGRDAVAVAVIGADGASVDRVAAIDHGSPQVRCRPRSLPRLHTAHAPTLGVPRALQLSARWRSGPLVPALSLASVSLFVLAAARGLDRPRRPPPTSPSCIRRARPMAREASGARAPHRRRLAVAPCPTAARHSDDPGDPPSSARCDGRRRPGPTVPGDRRVAVEHEGVVPKPGVEPGPSCPERCLRPSRLPVPPLRRGHRS